MDSNLCLTKNNFTDYILIHSHFHTSKDIKQKISIKEFFFEEQADASCSNLLQVHAGGKIHCASPFLFQVKPIPCCLLFYVVKGEGLLKSGNQCQSVSSGSLLFFECSTSLSFEITKAPFSCHLYFISGPMLAAYTSRLLYSGTEKTPLQNMFFLPLLQTGNHMVSLLNQCDHALAHQMNPDYKFMLSSCMQTLLTELIFSSDSEKAEMENLPKHLLMVKQLLDTEYQQNFALEDLEKLTGMSKYTICHDFSKYLNISPLQYRNKKRMEAAKRLLCNTDDTIHQISQTVGFENTTHFIQLFTRATGLTPLQYRNAHV